MAEAKKPQQSAASGNGLAARIYVELVARNTEIDEGAVKMKASATNLAILSIKLAEAFVQADEQATAAKLPVTGFKLEGSNIAEWSK